MDGAIVGDQLRRDARAGTVARPVGHRHPDAALPATAAISGDQRTADDGRGLIAWSEHAAIATNGILCAMARRRGRDEPKQ